MQGLEAIGFIGTGTIGGPMARRLLETGFALVVHDLRAEALHPLVEAGARTAASPCEVAGRCRVVLTSLPGPAQVESVVCGEGGLLAGARRGDVHVDLSTNSWAMVRRLAEVEARAGVDLVDAPVSGGAAGAAQGTLTVMASGSRTAFDRVEPLLHSLGRNVFHLGDSGAGTLVKLANNAVFLCAGLLAQEVFVLAAKAGLEPARLLEVLRTGSAGMYLGLAELFLRRGFEAPIFQLALAEKDVALALDSARELAVPMPVTSAAHQTYVRALAQGLGSQAFFATLRAVESAAGVEVPKLADS
jgi:3-hydroxyisobutyrate dehydrogenase-like beta-hydroxyacid dehydrogenase